MRTSRVMRRDEQLRGLTPRVEFLAAPFERELTDDAGSWTRQ